MWLNFWNFGWFGLIVVFKWDLNRICNFGRLNGINLLLIWGIYLFGVGVRIGSCINWCDGEYRGNGFGRKGNIFIFCVIDIGCFGKKLKIVGIFLFCNSDNRVLKMKDSGMKGCSGEWFGGNGVCYRGVFGEYFWKIVFFIWCIGKFDGNGKGGDVIWGWYWGRFIGRKGSCLIGLKEFFEVRCGKVLGWLKGGFVYLLLRVFFLYLVEFLNML